MMYAKQERLKLLLDNIDENIDLLPEILSYVIMAY